MGFIQEHFEDHAMAKANSPNRQRYWWEATERQPASLGFCAQGGLSLVATQPEHRLEQWEKNPAKPNLVVGGNALPAESPLPPR